LTRREKLELVVEILRIYVPARVRLRRDNLRTMAELARRDPRVTLDLEPSQAAALAIRLGKAVVRTLMLLPTDSRCLIRSLVLLRLLARRGIESTLVIGVRYEDQPFAAHAWIEHQQIPLLATGGGSFARLLEI